MRGIRYFLGLLLACVMIELYPIVLNQAFVDRRNQKQLDAYLQANAKKVSISFKTSEVEKNAADKLQMSVADLQQWVTTGQKPGSSLLVPTPATPSTPVIFKPAPITPQPEPSVIRGGQTESSSSSSSSEIDKAGQLRQALAKKELEKVWDTGTKKFKNVDEAFVNNYLNLSTEDKETFFDTVFDSDKLADLNPFDITTFKPRIGKFSNEQVRKKFFENLTYYGPAENKVAYEILVEEYLSTPIFVAPVVKPGEIPPPPPLPPVKQSGTSEVFQPVVVPPVTKKSSVVRQ